jgi:hypothetical protein
MGQQQNSPVCLFNRFVDTSQHVDLNQWQSQCFGINCWDATSSSQETSVRLLVIAAVLSLTPVSAFAVSDCRVTGNPAVFGVDMTAYVAVRSGETCNFPIRIPGAMHSSGVSRKPAHGTLRQLNVTTFRYTAASGYKGNDTFAIYGEGKGPYGSGRSVMTVNATID